MTGLVYKEFKQNRKYIIAVFAAPAAVAYLLGSLLLDRLVLPDSEEAKSLMSSIRDGDNIVFWATTIVLGFVAAAVFQGMIWGGDKKLWAGFVASTPKGIKDYIRIKYGLTLIMVLLCLLSMQAGEWIMSLVCKSNDAEWFGFFSAIIVLSCVQLICRAAEIPFIIRFGVKNGSLIKTILLVVIAFICVIYYVINKAAVIKYLLKVKGSDISKVIDTPSPFLFTAAAVLFYLSYRLSCKLYMKGAEDHN